MLTADIFSLAPDLASVDMHGVEKAPEKCVLHSANTGTHCYMHLPVICIFRVILVIITNAGIRCIEITVCEHRHGRLKTYGRHWFGS